MNAVPKTQPSQKPARSPRPRHSRVSAATASGSRQTQWQRLERERGGDACERGRHGACEQPHGASSSEPLAAAGCRATGANLPDRVPGRPTGPVPDATRARHPSDRSRPRRLRGS